MAHHLEMVFIGPHEATGDGVAHEKAVCSSFEQCAWPGDGVVSWRVVLGCVSYVVELPVYGVRAGTASRG